MRASKELPIIVAGGGIGGLCTALALARKGIPVKVLERAPGVGEIGFGIQMAPNGHAILHHLGVMPALEPYVFYPDALVMADAIDGEELTRIDLGEKFKARYKYSYFVVHRRDLHAALFEACQKEPLFSIETEAKEVVDYTDHGKAVTVNCADGSSYEGCALVGVEGLHSKTRVRIVKDRPRPTGHVVYRGLVPIEEINDKSYVNSMVIYTGPGCHLVQYRLRGGTVMNNVATFESPGFKQGLPHYGGKDELFPAFKDCAPKVQDMLRYISLDKNWVLHDLHPATNWTEGNVTLLGDAAHASLQYLAQGAIMSMEDALILASEVAQNGDDLHAAFISYQQQRLERTARVITTARIFGSICHASEGERLLRNKLSKQRDIHSTWEIDWLYRGANLLEKVG